MSDVIQVAATGRAQCRGCGRKIAAGELRFGESLPSAFSEKDALHWFHLVCAACMRPEKLLPALESLAEPVPDREWLREAAELGRELPRLPRLARAERAASGRARCRSCHEPIQNGSWRLVLQLWEEGRFNAAGFLHPECSQAYLGTARLLERLQRLGPGLDAAGAAELERLLENQRPAPPDDAERPPLAKTTGGAEPELEAERKARG